MQEKNWAWFFGLTYCAFLLPEQKPIGGPKEIENGAS